jgi:NlpC/P60 family putative phage cell wall peptidase
LVEAWEQKSRNKPGMPTREAIVTAARGWLGTPYHHQASVRGAGCDCLGLIRGVWRALYGPEPEAMPAYTRDWGNATGSETLIAAACRHLARLDDLGEVGPGDVLVFRMRDGGVAKHAGLISALPASVLFERDVSTLPASGLLERDVSTLPPFAPGSRPGRHPEVHAQRASKDSRAPHHDAEKEPRMIHAQEGLGVVEIPLGRWWVRRTRAGGDSWQGLEVPLGEDEERYRLDILDGPGGAVLRTIETTEPVFSYTSAMQTTDFGAPQWNVSIRVAQVSPVYGPGPVADQLTYDYQH